MAVNITTRKARIASAYIFHALFILLGFILMTNHCLTLTLLFALSGMVYLGYLIYLIMQDKMGYLSWEVCLHFLIGSAVEFILNWFSIIPKDESSFAGMGQLVYIIVLLCCTALVVGGNAILWLVNKIANHLGE